MMILGTLAASQDLRVNSGSQETIVDIPRNELMSEELLKVIPVKKEWKMLLKVQVMLLNHILIRVWIQVK